MVYSGAVAELCRSDLAKEDVFEDSREYRMLRRVLKRITPLTLTDSNAPDFTPAACATCHDIARYVHQKAVEELIELSETHLERNEGAPRRLATALPLGLTLIDVEGGLSATPRARRWTRPTCAACRSWPCWRDGRSGMWGTDPAGWT